MRRFSGLSTAFSALASTLVLAGCLATSPVPPLAPKQRPTGLVAPPAPHALRTPSQASIDLARYYARVQSDLLIQGLLRTDGGGPDTPYTADNLTQNFDRIALYNEYAQNRGLNATGASPSFLRRWRGPVRMSLEFGASVSKEIRTVDRNYVANYANRLARVTSHPITLTDSNPNFYILVMSEDDKATTVARVRQIAPNIDRTSLSVFENIPRSIHCLVVAFSGSTNDHEYVRAIALVRAEHPDLMRRSCYHEELAQGLGLANDSPRARPSIFNDDDEFALLTTHDEMLLRILYNNRLRIGMNANQALPIVQQIASSLVGGPS